MWGKEVSRSGGFEAHGAVGTDSKEVGRSGGPLKRLLGAIEGTMLIDHSLSRRQDEESAPRLARLVGGPVDLGPRKGERLKRFDGTIRLRMGSHDSLLC